MTSIPIQTHTVAVEAIDGAAALDLERRLQHLAPTTVGRRGRWVVDVAGIDDDELEELGVVVRQWLDAMGEPSTTMRVDGIEWCIRGRRHAVEAEAHLSLNRRFIG